MLSSRDLRCASLVSTRSIKRMEAGAPSSRRYRSARIVVTLGITLLLAVGYAPSYSQADQNIANQLIGKMFRFAAHNYPDHVMRHYNAELWISYHNTSDPQLELDSAFYAVPGLAGVGVSFKSKNYRDHYVRHSNWAVYISKQENTQQFKNDATWIPRQAFATQQGGIYSFESVNVPGHFLRHSSGRLYISQSESWEPFLSDASWRAQEPAEFCPCQYKHYFHPQDTVWTQGFYFNGYYATACNERNSWTCGSGGFVPNGECKVSSEYKAGWNQNIPVRINASWEETQPRTFSCHASKSGWSYTLTDLSAAEFEACRRDIVSYVHELKQMDWPDRTYNPIFPGCLNGDF